MNTTDELIERLNSLNNATFVIPRYVKELDRIDPRYSEVALRIIGAKENGSGTYAKGTVIESIRKWTEDSQMFKSMKAHAQKREEEFGWSYSEPLLALEEAIPYNSVITMTGIENHNWYELSQAAHTGDYYLNSKKVLKRPDIMGISEDEINAYYRPIAVAGLLLDVDSDTVGFLAEAPVFLEWIRGQKNIDGILNLALWSKTLDIDHLSELAAMQGKTPAPLHGGII